MDDRDAKLEERYAAWQTAEHALDAHEDAAWQATIRPDGTYLLHPAAPLDGAWVARDEALRRARDAARAAFLERLPAARRG